MNKLVVKDNALINASYGLSLTEQRLILLAIIEARRNYNKDSFDRRLIVKAATYCEAFTVDPEAAYKSLKKAATDLLERRFTFNQIIDGQVVKITTRWVSEVGYAANEAFVMIRFSHTVTPLITELERHFTSYELSQVADLKSGYAVRLYEILIAWRKTGSVPPIPLEELRDRLGVLEDEYQRMHHFKARVLDFAIEQINEHTDITASYDQHKNGRKIAAISFKFKVKENQEKLVKSDSFINLSAKQIELFSKKLAELPELGSQAPIGASKADYARLISENLKDANEQQHYLKHLAKVGYKPSKKKAS